MFVDIRRLELDIKLFYWFMVSSNYI